MKGDHISPPIYIQGLVSVVVHREGVQFEAPKQRITGCYGTRVTEFTPKTVPFYILVLGKFYTWFTDQK